ncbi:hypothetical protein BHE74_00051662 [Ensete ventricosum]|nr:hypothetical protein BHE74_00051662 [Ensete ventricosum]
MCIGHSSDLDHKSADKLSEGFFASLRQAEERRGSCFRWVLAMKLSSNFFVRESKEETNDGLSRLYHIRAGPLRVVGKARHMRETEVYPWPEEGTVPPPPVALLDLASIGRLPVVEVAEGRLAVGTFVEGRSAVGMPTSILTGEYVG